MIGDGSTRVVVSNTICRLLNLFNLLYLINWRHFSSKKLLTDEATKIRIFVSASASSSNTNLFQEKCFQFIRYNNLARCRGLKTVFEDMTLVLPCPNINKSWFPLDVKEDYVAWVSIRNAWPYVSTAILILTSSHRFGLLYRLELTSRFTRCK